MDPVSPDRVITTRALTRADLAPLVGPWRLIDAGLFRGATVSRDQAAQLLARLGLRLG
jgi:hypothetical protein